MVAGFEGVVNQRVASESESVRVPRNATRFLNKLDAASLDLPTERANWGQRKAKSGRDARAPCRKESYFIVDIFQK